MYAWFMTVWTSNWLDVERRKVQLLLLGLMFASLLMSTSITAAFDYTPPWSWIGDRAALFVVGYLAIQFGRTIFAVAAFRGHRLHDHFANALAWEAGTATIWIAGIFVDGDARLAIWALAVAVTYGGVIAGHPLPNRRSPFSTDSQIYAEHLLERFRLFFLIALGETVLTIGNAFADVPPRLRPGARGAGRRLPRPRPAHVPARGPLRRDRRQRGPLRRRRRRHAGGGGAPPYFLTVTVSFIFVGWIVQMKS
jgi:low temperature requirement protein LtrA